MTGRRFVRKQAGFSLLELMISLVLGVLVIAGVLQVFSSSKNAYQMQNASSRVQEAGRFALELLKTELRVGDGLNFCIAETPINNLLNTGGAGYQEVLFDPDVTVVAWEYNGTANGEAYNLPAPALAGGGGNWKGNGPANLDLPDVIARRAIAGSDVLLVKSGEQLPGLTPCSGNSSTSSSLSTNFGADCPVGSLEAPITNDQMCELLPQNALVLVTDCGGNADLYQRTSTCGANSITRGSGSSPGNAGGLNWDTAYNDSAHFYAVHSVAYYVGLNAAGEPALFQLDFGRGGSAAAPIELVEGVESMQVQLAELSPAGVLDYQEGEAIADPRRVQGISVSLLIRSGAVADTEVDSLQYNLAGLTVDPIDDNRLRRVFSTTVGVRNRIVVN